MKLDKFGFARVVTIVSRIAGRNVFDDEMLDLDAAITIEMPAVETPKADPGEVENLMRFMAGGKLKIEAIKSFRTLTGQGLKESKDAVERYWIGNREGATLGDILGQATK